MSKDTLCAAFLYAKNALQKHPTEPTVGSVKSSIQGCYADCTIRVYKFAVVLTSAERRDVSFLSLAAKCCLHVERNVENRAAQNKNVTCQFARRSSCERLGSSNFVRAWRPKIRNCVLITKGNNDSHIYPKFLYLTEPAVIDLGVNEAITVFQLVLYPLLQSRERYDCFKSFTNMIIFKLSRQ